MTGYVSASSAGSLLVSAAVRDTPARTRRLFPSVYPSHNPHTTASGPRRRRHRRLQRCSQRSPGATSPQNLRFSRMQRVYSRTLRRMSSESSSSCLNSCSSHPHDSCMRWSRCAAAHDTAGGAVQRSDHGQPYSVHTPSHAGLSCSSCVLSRVLPTPNAIPSHCRAMPTPFLPQCPHTAPKALHSAHHSSTAPRSGLTRQACTRPPPNLTPSHSVEASSLQFSYSCGSARKSMAASNCSLKICLEQAGASSSFTSLCHGWGCSAVALRCAQMERRAAVALAMRGLRDRRMERERRDRADGAVTLGGQQKWSETGYYTHPLFLPSAALTIVQYAAAATVALEPVLVSAPAAPTAGRR